MEKLKKVFSPGSNKDDEVMYGTPVPKTSEASHNSEPLGNDESNSVPAGNSGISSTQHAQPSGAPETASSAQEPSQREYDGASSLKQPQPRGGDDGASGLSIKSGKEGPYAGESTTRDAAPAPSIQPKQGYASRDAEGLESSHPDVGRDATIAGAGAGAAGMGAEALGAHEQRPQDDVSNATYTDRSFPLSGGSANTAPNEPSSDLTGTGSSAADRMGQEAPTSSGHSMQTAAGGEPFATTGQHSDVLRDTALAGAGAGVGATAADAFAHREEVPRNENVEPSTEPTHSHPSGLSGIEEFHHDDEKPVGGTFRHVQGPHALDTANRLDPHVPGEFPDESGEDPHKHAHGSDDVLKDTTNIPISSEGAGGAPDSHYGRDAALTGSAGAIGATGYEASKDHSEMEDPVQPQTATGSDHMAPQDPVTARDPEDEHHYGRDAALAGGAGALGVGGYEAMKDRSEKAAPGQSGNFDRQNEITPQESGTGGISQPSQIGPREPSSAEIPHHEHHYGRDAAVAGGTGAAGLGAYEAAKYHGSEEPVGPQEPASMSSEPVGPQEPSSMPKEPVGPQEPSSMSREPVGPQEPSAAEVPHQEHHYGRDAAIAGGTGAAGLGAYEALKDDEPKEPVAGPTGEQRFDQPQSQLVPQVAEQPKQTSSAVPYEPQGSSRSAAAMPYEQAGNPYETREPEQQQPDQHLGRDAALAGGAGAAGLGTYEYGKDRDDIGPTLEPVSSRADPVARTAGPEPSDMKEKPKDPQPYTTKQPERSQPAAYGKEAPEPAKEDPSKQSHLGRDAAVAGGAGAAGYGTYEALADYNDPARTQQAAKEQSSHPHVAQDPHGHNKLHKSPGQEAKHERKLEEAREKEAEKEKKPGLLSKILHPHKHKHEHEEEPKQAQQIPREQQSRHVGTDGAIGDDHHVSGSNPTTSNEDDVRIEPHTGLPMNVGKYGTTGSGGTDGAQQIEGYHEQDPALQHATQGTAHGADKGNYVHPGEEGVAGPDWENIKKANTPY